MISGNVSVIARKLPLFESRQQFDMGHYFDWDAGAAIDLSAGREILEAQRIGTWACELGNSELTWSPTVHDLFGIAQESVANRKKAVTLYREASRAKMERLRAYAIKHGKAFTLDAEIVPANGGRRWIRMIAVPVLVDGRVVRINGYKQDVSHEYY